MNINVSLQPILWSKDIKKINLCKDKIYIINQILAFGTLDHLRWLFKTYKAKEVVKIFLEHPLKIYQKSTFHFIKEILLELEGGLPEEKYVATTPRNIR